MQTVALTPTKFSTVFMFTKYKKMQNKSKMADSYHCEKLKKPPHLRNGFTDRHQILHVDAYWPPSH